MESAGLPARRKIVGRRHCRAGPFVGSIALWKAEARSSPMMECVRAMPVTAGPAFPFRLCLESQEATDILWGELDPRFCPQCVDAEHTEILVEVPEPR